MSESRLILTVVKQFGPLGWTELFLLLSIPLAIVVFWALLRVASTIFWGAKPKTETLIISPLDQLKKLQELRDAGAITEEEFQAKKKELLAKI